MTQINLLRQVKNLNFPEGFLINWQIVTSVSSWNLTVAIKTLAWTDPSTTDPVYCRIGWVVRSITSALDVLTSQSDWFNSSSSELANKEIDYFVYLYFKSSDSSIWLWFSRIPYYNMYSESIQVYNNERYIRTSSDISWTSSILVNIWRFNAILSAWPSYTWSIPATSLIINRPVFESRELATANFKMKVVWDTVILTRDVSITISSWAESWNTAITYPITYSASDYWLWLWGFSAAAYASLNETPFPSYNSKTTTWIILYWITRSWTVGANRAWVLPIIIRWKW